MSTKDLRKKLEIEVYINNNANLETKLMHCYFLEKEYYLLYYLANKNRNHKNDALYLIYYVISLYGMGEIFILTKYIKTEAIDFLGIYYESDIPKELKDEYIKIMFKMLTEQISTPDALNYHLERHSYTRPKYDIISYSDKMGDNMTVIRCYYGVIIIDCGAIEKQPLISVRDFEEFFQRNDIEKNDILGVFITHAHFDHYGSISNLNAWGIPWTKFYATPLTKELIIITNKDAYANNLYEFNDYYHPKVNITPFPNGHIPGSVGLLIEFDDINIIHSGDFCFHDQKSVIGLNEKQLIELIKNKPIDCLITETTNGKNLFEVSYETNIKILEKLLVFFKEHQFKLFFPAFSVGRTQEIICRLKELFYNQLNISVDGTAAKVTSYIDNLGLLDYPLFNGLVKQVGLLDKLAVIEQNDIIVSSPGKLGYESASYQYIKELLKGDNLPYKVKIVKTGFLLPDSDGQMLLNKWEIEQNEIIDISLTAHASYYQLWRLINIVKAKTVFQIHGDGLI